MGNDGNHRALRRTAVNPSARRRDISRFMHCVCSIRWPDHSPTTGRVAGTHLRVPGRRVIQHLLPRVGAARPKNASPAVAYSPTGASKPPHASATTRRGDLGHRAREWLLDDYPLVVLVGDARTDHRYERFEHRCLARICVRRRSGRAALHLPQTRSLCLGAIWRVASSILPRRRWWLGCSGRRAVDARIGP